MATKTIELNFMVLDTHETKTLGVADITLVPQGAVITSPTIEITPPSFAKVVKEYSLGAINIFNSNDLGLTCVESTSMLSDLPDGIWTIKVSVAPAFKYNLEKKFMRTEHIERKFSKALLLTDIEECNSKIKATDKQTLDDIDYYIRGSIAEANNCNYPLAMDMYTLANDMLTNLLDSKNAC